MKKYLSPSLLGGALLAATAAFPASAQSTSSTETSSETVQLEKLSVSEVPLAQQILPTSRPFNSVFGTDDNIVDVPRNVTIISRQQLTDISIVDVRDFTKLTSSSYTPSNFGAPANPSIRGQSSDLFLNGMRFRITSNGNGLPLDFNSVESVNIVKGPASAVQGSSMYVGGFVDLISKRPYFDGFKGSVSTTIGSYSQKEWNIDVGGPLSDKLAYRFSYSGKDSKGYWHDWYNKLNSLYGAVTYKVTPDYEIFMNASANFYRYTENWGINRVTQDLIDHNQYVTGINTNNGAGAPSDAQNSKYVLGGGNTVAWGPTVTINRHERLLKPGDHSTGREFNAQIIQTKAVSADFKIQNNTYWSYTARNTLSSYYYSEIIDPSTFAENRTDFIFSKPFVSLNTGLDLRWQHTAAYDDYFFEPANVWDLTKDHNYINVYNATAFSGRFVGQPVPGWPGRFATQGTINGDTNDSWAITAGPFAQATWKLGDKFNVVTGGRLDNLHASVRDPLTSPVVKDSITVWIPNYNGSLVFKPTPKTSVYATYNYSKNTSGAVGNGGGITGWDGSGTKLDKQNFLQPSELIEIGSKYSLINDKLFLNVALYDQKRTAKTTSSTDVVQFHAKGLEFELNYQPNKRVYATFSYSATDATVSPGFQSDGGTAFLPTQGVDYVNVHNVPALPKNSFSSLLSYRFDNGFGFSVNGTLTSPINNNYAGTLVIPWQYTIDAGVWYRYQKQWEFRLQVLNLTDEENWSSVNPVYGNASIVANAGTTFSLTAKYSF